MNRSHLRSRTILATLAVLVVPTAPASASHKVYRKVAPSTVAFAGRNGAAIGAGVVVDVERRLVVTAYHVINGSAGQDLGVRVFFPLRDKDRIVTDAYLYARAYRKSPASLIIPGKVIAFDPIKDLAVVQLDKVPQGVTAVPLAKEDPEPGEAVHVIGNSTGGRGGLFGYNKGFVRNNFLHGKNNYCFFALCHQSPTNFGDSGGPVVNDAGELIAIISHGTTGQGDVEQVVDYSVHVREIRALLAGQHTSKTPCLLPTPGFPISFQGKANLEAQEDMLIFRVQAKNVIDLEMKGNGKSDLDLFLDQGLDGKAFRKVAREGDSDQEAVRVQADWSGVARVTVKNFHSRQTRDELRRLDKTFPKKTESNDYALKIARGQLGGPFTMIRTLPPGATDQLTLHYVHGKREARVTIYGDGKEDIDLTVLDPQGKEVGRSDTYESRETVAWTPQATGLFTIQVKNLGGAGKHSRYFLMTD